MDTVYIVTWWQKDGARIREVDDREMMTELVDNLLEAEISHHKIKVYHATPKQVRVTVEA